jgi:hypothetical protein
MDVRLQVRRARRDDLDRVRALLGVVDTPAPRERKRWRRLVSTLREDLYLAEREDDDTLVGLAVIVYVRGLGPPAAIVRQLHSVSDAAARVLLDCARARAAARGCAQLEVQLEAGDQVGAPSGATALADTLAADGWSAGPRTMIRRLSA